MAILVVTAGVMPPVGICSGAGGAGHDRAGGVGRVAQQLLPWSLTMKPSRSTLNWPLRVYSTAPAGS